MDVEQISEPKFNLKVDLSELKLIGESLAELLVISNLNLTKRNSIVDLLDPIDTALEALGIAD